LRGMGFIGDYGKAFSFRSRQFLNFGEGEWEGLQGADDDFFAIFQGLGQFLAFAVAFAGYSSQYTLGTLKRHQGFA